MRAAPVALVVIATLAPWGAADARPKKKKAAELVDISAAKSQLKVLTDSDGSIYVMIDANVRGVDGEATPVYRLAPVERTSTSARR